MEGLASPDEDVCSSEVFVGLRFDLAKPSRAFCFQEFGVRAFGNWGLRFMRFGCRGLFQFSRLTVL